MTDFAVMPAALAPIGSVRPTPVDGPGLIERLRLTGVAAGYALLMAPALPLAILTILAVPLGLVTAGFVIALGVVPATAALTAVHRRVSGALLGETITAAYADTSGTNVVTRPLRWLRDGARWRDVGFLWFSATGGFVLSVLPVALLTTPFVHLVGALADGSLWWWLLVLLDGPLLLVWWCVTPALVRARAVAERNILGGDRVERLERRVEEVATSRAETLDHSAAEVRRIERDLHDGAQARIASVGMNVGLAEKLIATDPEGAAALLREARETTVDALEDLRSVVRGIHPPALADRGLAGGIEALALPIPLPVTVSLDVPAGLPAPVESAADFAVAERNILGSARVAELERRVEQVTTSRAETLDHSAAEVRRIERDLHDGAQARIAAVGMNVGLAEKLMATDPDAAAELLREARETTVDALEDLRSVVRGIHPPALADRGLAGGLEALALPIPLPITVTVDAGELPAPVESAAYFAVAECLANTVKHAGATRAWIRVRHDAEVLHLVVGDDGRGGADPQGSGLAGVARRLAAFDGRMVVESPSGGPTVVTMEVPCPQ